jgi:LuxR family maltose regulon positive regulatory protein
MTAVRLNDGEPSRITAHAAIKLRVPAVAGSYVARSRLIEQLDSAATEGVIVVHGPAGSGKTSLVAGWVSTLTMPVSWFTLDERDRTPAEFWTNLVVAVDRLRPGVLDALDPLLRSGAPCDVMSDELVVTLDAASGEPAVLVLDDFQMIAESPRLLEVFRDLIRHQPAALQLVIVSRSIPALPLERARAGGRATTIGFDDLRFSEGEANEMLGRLAPDGDQAWADATIAQVGGWAAGLQLFALATRSSRATDALTPDLDPTEMRATPAMQITADYLLAEAFRDEPDEVVELLRQIAVVGRVSVPLARRLTGREDADVLLHRAFARDLFVSRRGRGWYELHSLVRDVLLDQLDEDPERARCVHARAAACLEDDREYASALEHWAASGQHRETLRLLSEVHLALYDSGRHDVVRRTIESMPIETYTTDFAAMMAFTWCHVLIDRARFLDGVARLSWWAQRTPVVGVLSARLTLLQSVATTVHGDWVEGGRLARRAMADLGPEWVLDAYGRFGFNMVARDVALSERWHDDDEDVRLADLELAHDPVRRMSFEGIRALGEALAGHPLAALQTAGGVRDLADVANMSILGDELRLAEVVARREIGAVDEVVAALEALAASDVAPTTYVRARALSELVASHLDHGATHAAQHALDSLRDLVDSSAGGVGARTLVARCAVDVALATGQIDDAERWVEEISDAFWRPVGRARTSIARLDFPAAQRSLIDAEPRCIRHDVVLGLQRSVATPDHEEALKYATAAVEAAAAHGLVQTVASQGRAAVELVERCAWRSPTAWLERVRLASVNGLGTERAVRSRSEQPTPVDPLTEREREVLRFLPSRLTLQEIAGELYISMNTLKFHLKVIYRKLGVSSRAEAAEFARTMASDRTGGQKEVRR